ncbi:hypothetical protein GT755_03750 [Herbidospora sp. NEAU-GS84]|uniref:Lipoprotein n=1 Tax=Herbidospora solisilvae TaxID=2696284 RepID=A0A7C9NKM6_9ACTN|nr:hypothetical protein [Herbidospora solisilvae]NAS20796.1 hypothetical protein [Herbidospora solisilvae]
MLKYVMGLALPVSACAAGGGPAVEEAAGRFFAAVAAGQGAAACALLTDAAARSLPEPCATSILDAGLRGGPAEEVAVWGSEAQLRLPEDTVFLHRGPDGWRVRGAGCRPQGDRPYDCEVSG